MDLFKSYNLERIVNSQKQNLKSALLEFIATTSKGRTIDYTHTIDINFEERRHKVMREMAVIRSSKYYNPVDYKRLEKTLYRLSSVNSIEYDLKAFLRRIKNKIDFDAFYLFPDNNHVHMLLVLYDGDIKHFTNMAKRRPYCWDIIVGAFKLDFMDDYLENKVKYIMSKKNLNTNRYENIIYDFYPDRERIDTFFDRFPTVYDYKLHEMSRKLRERFSN